MELARINSKLQLANINSKLQLIKEIKDRTGFSLRLCKEFTDLLYGHGFCKYNKYTDTYSFDISKITSYTDLLFLNEKSASIDDLHIKRLIEII